jgi:hypothetical protein
VKNLNRLQQKLLKPILINLFFLSLSLIWYRQQPAASGAELALAKGSQIFQMMHVLPGKLIDYAQVQTMALADKGLADLLAGKEYDFLNALPLSAGEARYWQDLGCDQYNCVLVSLINYTDGGTVEALLQMERGEVIGRWTNPQARPNGSQFILAKAVQIAAADPQVQAILGDIGAADPAMIPMSGWLMDDDCADEWCVDLTFHDPDGTGRIFHIFVNMQQDKVARTFYTRARPERGYARPPEQRNAYSDGCMEQDGWSVCWEMTGHDGLHFIDAAYNKTLIFASAKIPQVEAWYPSWPGGYRDEIGFAASVPPFGDTQVVDFGDGFEVRQLFTEFTSWPNCICCYRYEEIMRFNADGSFETRFVSHGPGCDDLSVYRPFWRIDLDLDGGELDQVWLWDNNQWNEGMTEFESEPFIRPVSPDGFKLATFDSDTHYRWRMERTDPLSLDEAHLFALLEKPMEGDGPTAPGPGDTYEPPRQWQDDEQLSGQDIVLWFVPSLKTKKGSPWWCMPDPEPDFSPCEAILHAEPAGELHQPTEEEIFAAALATVTAASSGLDAGSTPTPLSPPLPTPTPRPIQGQSPEDIILNSGCGACHTIGELGEKGKVGPDLSSIGLVAGSRVPDMTAENYIRQSILEPNAFIAPDCPNSACLSNIMPRDYALRLTSEQVEIMVRFLLAQTADPTPTATAVRIGDNAPATPAPKAFPAPKRISPTSSGTDLPYIAIQILLVSLVF